MVPGHWNIVLSGPRAGIFYIIINSDVNSQELEPGPRLLNSAASEPGSTIKVHETGKCGNLEDGSEQYEVTAPGMATAFVREGWSCGSGGCSIQFILAPTKEDAQEIVGCN
jgi:hypothetical protein